jgi:hypothetical protein
MIPADINDVLPQDSPSISVHMAEYYCCLFAVLGANSKASHMLSMASTAEVHLQPKDFFFSESCYVSQTGLNL